MALSQVQKTLITRIFSAVVAVGTLLTIYFYFQVEGLKFICFFAVLLGAREMVRLLFINNESSLLRSVFYVLVLLIFSISAIIPEKSGLWFALLSIFFCCFSLIFEEKFKDLSQLSAFQAKSILGFFYMGLLPSFAFRILELPNGIIWFLAMLAIIFAGDTFAYLTGMKLGKHQLMPNVSPKKTVEGSVGGLIGSAMVAILFHFLIPNISIIEFILIGLSAGIFGQLGDLFESMLKRIAAIKDSGSIMPGHGGVLDRLDGVFFAAPIIYFFAEWLDKVS